MKVLGAAVLIALLFSSTAQGGTLHCFTPDIEPGFSVDVMDETPGPGFSAGAVTIGYWYLERKDHYEDVAFIPHHAVGTMVARSDDGSETLVITVLPFERGERYPLPGRIQRISEDGSEFYQLRCELAEG